MRGDKSHPANFGRLCVKGSSLGAGADAGRAPAASAHRRRAGELGRRARLVARDVPRDHRRARPGLGRLLCLRPIADRGLLRRQQADEGLYRLGQYRHQFAPVHVVLGRRPQARLRLGHRARLLRGSGTGRSRRAGRLQSRLVPPDPVSSAWRRRASRRGGMPKIVNIDPRRTATSEIADLHLSLRAGLRCRAVHRPAARAEPRRQAREEVRRRRIRRGVDEALAAAKSWTLDKVAAETGLAPRGPATASTIWSSTPNKTVTVYSQGVNQSSSGTDKVNAIINTHLLTGRIGKPGCGPFSVTGQPNAMGGREVGGLANMLAAHMELDNPGPSRARAGFLGRAAHRRQARPQGGRPVPGHRRGPGQGGLDHGHQSGGQPARRRFRPRGAEEMSLRRRLRRRAKTPTPLRSPMCCCPRWPGARRTAR